MYKLIGAILLVSSLPTGLLAQLTEHGTAQGNVPEENCIQVTDAIENQAGWAYWGAKLDLTVAVKFNFTAYLGADPDGADGMVFMLHNDPRGTDARGCVGEALGYATHPTTNGVQCNDGNYYKIEPSIAIEFDTHTNGNQNDPNDSHIAYLENGIVNHDSIPNSVVNITDPVLKSDTEFPIEIIWLPDEEEPENSVLQVFWGDDLENPILEIQKDLVTEIFNGDPEVYVGLAGSTGGSMNQQYLCDFQINDVHVLPVEISHFEAIPNKEQVSLVWKTAREQENSHFEIEKSVDGTHFETIGHIPGNGTYQGTQKYSWYDAEPNTGINYYRLKQVDFSGKVHHHNVVSVNYEGETGLWVQLAPNTTHGEELSFYFQPRTSSGAMATIYIHDLKGKVVHKENINMVEQQRFDLTFSNKLDKGIYLVTVENQEGIERLKFVVY